MTLTLVLLAMRQKRPKTARKVVWCRLDQKTCVKAVVGAGLELVVVPPLLRGLSSSPRVAAIERAIDASECGADDIVCVVTSTSCFAPRGCDDIAAVAKLCAAKGVGHVVNHAYGVQARQLCDAVTRGWRRGRVDAVVQSTDKNFMVPVGGAIVTSGKGRHERRGSGAEELPGEGLRRAEPGRADHAPVHGRGRVAARPARAGRGARVHARPTQARRGGARRTGARDPWEPDQHRGHARRLSGDGGGRGGRRATEARETTETRRRARRTCRFRFHALLASRLGHARGRAGEDAGRRRGDVRRVRREPRRVPDAPYFTAAAALGTTKARRTRFASAWGNVSPTTRGR